MPQFIWWWGVQLSIQMTDSSATYDVHYDYLGTPQFLTDAEQNIVWQQSMSAFGESTITDDIEFNFRFPGQYYDEESGLHYNYFRDYDPELGRYIQSDPIGLAGGINTYAYVEGNPIMYVDPLGLAKSGQTVKVPGTNTTVRIDNPHVPGQQRHAHVTAKGKPTIVINQDGTSSHNSDLKKLTKNKKVLEFLRKRGFKLGVFGIFPLSPQDAFCTVNPASCFEQPKCI